MNCLLGSDKLNKWITLWCGWNHETSCLEEKRLALLNEQRWDFALTLLELATLNQTPASSSCSAYIILGTCWMLPFKKAYTLPVLIQWNSHTAKEACLVILSCRTSGGSARTTCSWVSCVQRSLSLPHQRTHNYALLSSARTRNSKPKGRGGTLLRSACARTATTVSRYNRKGGRKAESQTEKAVPRLLHERQWSVSLARAPSHSLTCPEGSRKTEKNTTHSCISFSAPCSHHCTRNRKKGVQSCLWFQRVKKELSFAERERSAIIVWAIASPMKIACTVWRDIKGPCSSVWVVSLYFRLALWATVNWTNAKQKREWIMDAAAFWRLAKWLFYTLRTNEWTLGFRKRWNVQVRSPR